MDINEITYRYADIGHYVARCNHQTGVIELNSREYPHLSPMMKDFVWCHECVHLIYDEYDESKCNEIAYKYFVGRAGNEREHRERIHFVEASKGTPYTSNADVLSLVIGFLSEVITDIVTKTANNKAFFNYIENGGFNSYTTEQQKTIVDTMMAKAFRKSRRVDDRSAKDIFWGYMEQYVDKTLDSDYSHFMSRHKWVADYVAKYEKKFGFAFDEVLPINNTDIYLWIAAGTLAIIAIIYLIKKYRK